MNRDNYDALIQAAARLPGVRLQGMTSLASSDSRTSLADQLLKQALEPGQRRAQATVRALGLRKVELLLIDQRGSSYRPMAMAARMGEEPSGLRRLLSQVRDSHSNWITACVDCYRDHFI